MFTQHHRYAIHNKHQHPYKHTLDEFPYLNNALPEGEVQNLKQTLDWIIGVVYPNTQPAVDTVGDLPAAGNTINDYRVVNDDGDGKAAAYRWMQLEGDAVPEWKKIYDMDWGESSVLSNFLLKTQDVYVYRYGIDDLDETGTPFAGDLAGQRIYGGSTAGTHLLLFANSGDGVGAGTGFIQFGDNVRPLTDGDYTLGTDTYRFLNFYTDEANISTMQIVGGSITDTSGAIDFDDENLSTDGTISSGTLLLAGGSITDGSGAIDFNDENLTTTGVVTGNNFVGTGAASQFATGTTVGNLTLANGSITDSSGQISFGDENLLTTGSGTFGSVVVDNLTLDGNTLSSTAGDINLDATGQINLLDNTFVTGNLDVSGDIIVGAANNMTLDESGLATDQAFSISTSAGGLTFAPFTQQALFTADVMPSTDEGFDLGDTGMRWNDLWMSDTGFIRDDTLSIAVATIMAFRDAVAGASVGDSVFWNGSQYLPSAPDTEIDHGTISGLGDDDHTQYFLLAGRSGGSTAFGGTDANDNLVLDSTSNATKGFVQFASVPTPTSDLGTDLGDSSLRFDDLYMGGEGIGFRMQNAANFGALPGASGSNIGRLAWVVDTENIYVDTGGTWKQITSDKYVNDDAVTWDGTNVTQTYTVSADIDDARKALWQFLDNTNGFQQVQGAVITKTLTQVTVTFTIPPASGTYRLVGVG